MTAENSGARLVQGWERGFAPPAEFAAADRAILIAASLAETRLWQS